MLHRLHNMLTDFSGLEGEENALGCFIILGLGVVVAIGLVVWRLN
jgi:hypothetical protein